MALVLASKMFPFYLLSHLVTARSYPHPTEPPPPPDSGLEPGPRTRDPDGGAEGDRGEIFAVRCHRDGVEVKIQAHLMEDGPPGGPGRWRLGPPGGAPDACVARATPTGEYTIRARLDECGSRVMFTEDAVLYHNLLLFFPPSPDGDGGLQMGAAVPLLCEYDRRYRVSSGPLRPTWTPLVSVQSAQLPLGFRIRLMTDDWSKERRSAVYLMGETVHMEASVDPDHRPPLRLYAGGCVATLSPDVDSHPRYPFIDHQGCFTDSRLSGSGSRFLPRVRDHLLQIQLEPFLFHQDHRRTIYVTCHLEAAPASQTDHQKKACSFINGSWTSADGDHDVCQSCGDSNPETGQRRKREPTRKELHWQSTLGPILLLPDPAADRENPGM
ncbi:zona pellucida sperm-binding protein 3-like [Menidia menidia]